MIKVGILGSGFGKVHAEIYQRSEGFTVQSLFGRNKATLETIHRKLGVSVTDRIDDILDDPTIDLVDICLPSRVHAHYAIDALRRGKHVFCETPLAYSSHEAEAIQTVAREQGRLVFVDLFLKFAGAHAKALEMVRNRDLGEVQFLSTYNQTPSIWGDLSLQKNLWNFHLHNLDFITQMLGSPASVSSCGTGSDETSSLVTTSRHGLVLSMATSLSNLPPGSPFGLGFEVIGDEGVLRFEASFGPEHKFSFRRQKHGKEENLPVVPTDEYESVIRHVGDCLNRGEASSLLDVSQAILSLQMAESAQRSLGLQPFEP